VFFVAAERLAERLGLRRDLEPLSAKTAELTTEPGSGLSNERIGEPSIGLNTNPSTDRGMKR
jgi:hypothetical protein